MYCVIGIKQSYRKRLREATVDATGNVGHKAHEFTRLDLTVMCHNERAYKLYLSSGFEVEGRNGNH